MINPIGHDIGRAVIYTGSHLKGVERGVITSFTDYFVFVRFGTQTTSQGCRRENLKWDYNPKEDTHDKTI